MMRIRAAAVTGILAAAALFGALAPALATPVAAARRATWKPARSLAKRAARGGTARSGLGREKAFLWGASSFVVAGSAAAMAAIFVDRGEHWNAVLMVAPVCLAYQTYRLLIARLEDQRRHLDEMTRLQQERGVLLAREQAARASAEAANRLKDQFLATVSHELRTPMNAILGWADMLRLGTLPADRKGRACEAIFNNAMRQAHLIEQLLDMARITAGTLQLERSAVDPHEIATSALEMVQVAAEAKRIRIELDIPDHVGSFHADGPRLLQVLRNLLSNAVRFTPEDGAVRLAFHRAGNLAEIIVSDSGIGITREFLPAVFEPFRQADGTPTREHDGLGLGLAIVKQVVDAHGGAISVASDGAGRGATFTLRLPVAGVFPCAPDAPLRRQPNAQRLMTVADEVPSMVVPDCTTARTA